MESLPPLSSLVPLIREPLGIAALFAMAIWAGLRLSAMGIAALRDVSLARVAVQQALAEALAAQAAAVDGLRRAQAEQAIAVRLIAARIGIGWDDDMKRETVRGHDDGA